MRKLAVDQMAFRRNSQDDEAVALRHYGFQVMHLDGSANLEFGTMATKGDGVPVVPIPSICSTVEVYYMHSDLSPAGSRETPTKVEIDITGDPWIFNPNEVLAHADLFLWKSGVFSNSTRPYLRAERGRFMFVFSTSSQGLTVERIVIVAPTSTLNPLK
jgi:hypothetical protein